MSGARDRRLAQLTGRWRARHEARVRSVGLQPATAEREAQAHAFFPYATQTPAEYVSGYGAAMAGFTYDAYHYADPVLETWLREVGKLLRERRARSG